MRCNASSRAAAAAVPDTDALGEGAAEDDVELLDGVPEADGDGVAFFFSADVDGLGFGAAAAFGVGFGFGFGAGAVYGLIPG